MARYSTDIFAGTGMGITCLCPPDLQSISCATSVTNSRKFTRKHHGKISDIHANSRGNFFVPVHYICEYPTMELGGYICYFLDHNCSPGT